MIGLSEALLEFLLPKKCISCHERNFTRYPICPTCITGIDRIDPKTKLSKKGLDPAIQHYAALFLRSSPMRALNQDINHFAKAIAACLILHYYELPWGKIDAIHPYSGYHPVAKIFSKWTGIPTAKKRIEGKAILLIGPIPYTEIIEPPLLESKIFLLSYIAL